MYNEIFKLRIVRSVGKNFHFKCSAKILLKGRKIFQKLQRQNSDSFIYITPKHEIFVIFLSQPETTEYYKEKQFHAVLHPFYPLSSNSSIHLVSDFYREQGSFT